MLEIEAKIEAEKNSEEIKNFILELFENVDKCVFKGNADKTINMLQTFKETEAGKAVKFFIDFLIEHINDINDKIKLSAEDEATAVINNWSRLQKLIAQRGFTINSLSKETGIMPVTIKKHLRDGEFRCYQYLRIIEALQVPHGMLDYYIDDILQLARDRQSA